MPSCWSASTTVYPSRFAHSEWQAAPATRLRGYGGCAPETFNPVKARIPLVKLPIAGAAVRRTVRYASRFTGLRSPQHRHEIGRCKALGERANLEQIGLTTVLEHMGASCIT